MKTLSPFFMACNNSMVNYALSGKPFAGTRLNNTWYLSYHWMAEATPHVIVFCQGERKV
jgi:hypothetical protein